MLHAMAQLTQHRIGDVHWILGDEINAHALGADQPDHLLDLLQQDPGRFVEEQVGFVEEEHQPGLVDIPHFRQLLEQLGEHPQQKR